MYQRDDHNRLTVKGAWAIPHLPMCIIVELPDGQLKRFGVLMQDYYERHNERQFKARLPKDSDLREYKGYHPNIIPTAHAYSPQEAAIYGLNISIGSWLRSKPSDKRAKASAANGKAPVKPGSNPRGRPRKQT